MIEEFDAIRGLNLLQDLTNAAVLLLIGIVLEVALRFGKRWSLSRGYTWLPAVLNALAWQPLIWGLLLGVVSPLLSLMEDSRGWQHGPELVQSLLLILTTVILVRLINGLLRASTAKTPSASVSLLNNLVTGVGVLIVGAIVLGYLFNVSFVVLLVAIVGGITGLTVLFQKPLNDLVSGMSLTVSNRLAPGDWIRLPSGVEGNVIDIQWDVTIVKQLANNVIVIPNNILTEAEIINFDRPEHELSVAVGVGVSYDSDLAHVEQVTLEEASAIMRQVNGPVSTAEPVVRYNAFADSSINFNVFLRAARYADQFGLKHEFIKRLHQRYGEEGIVIPFPIRTLDVPPDLQGALTDQIRPETKER